MNVWLLGLDVVGLGEFAYFGVVIRFFLRPRGCSLAYYLSTGLQTDLTICQSGGLHSTSCCEQHSTKTLFADLSDFVQDVTVIHEIASAPVAVHDLRENANI